MICELLIKVVNKLLYSLFIPFFLTNVIYIVLYLTDDGCRPEMFCKSNKNVIEHIMCCRIHYKNIMNMNESQH